jgi:hypothetical protein
VKDLLCNWQVADRDEDGDIVVDEVGREMTSPCGNEPVAIYFERNPHRRRPDQPQDLTYPSCRIHDTKPRQKAADNLGYTREVL